MRQGGLFETELLLMLTGWRPVAGDSPFGDFYHQVQVRRGDRTDMARVNMVLATPRADSNTTNTEIDDCSPGLRAD